MARRTPVLLAAAVLAGSLVALAPTGPAADATGGLRRCRSADLRLSLSTPDPGEGQQDATLRLKNVSRHACRLRGFPRFRFEVDGHTVGSATSHAQDEMYGTDLPTPRVRLQAGDSAWSGFWYNDPVTGLDDGCDPVTVTTVRVKLPHRRHRYHLAYPATVCTGEGFMGEADPLRDSYYL